LLRRLSVHAAGLDEPTDNYVWENLAASTLEGGAASTFKKSKITSAMREYAIAGALHLDHLAGMLDSPANAPTLELTAYQLSESLGLAEDQTKHNLRRLLKQHSREWKTFMTTLGNNSFLADWALGARS
jgi:hypothetical protein